MRSRRVPTALILSLAQLSTKGGIDRKHSSFPVLFKIKWCMNKKCLQLKSLGKITNAKLQGGQDLPL